MVHFINSVSWGCVESKGKTCRHHQGWNTVVNCAGGSASFWSTAVFTLTHSLILWFCRPHSLSWGFIFHLWCVKTFTTLSSLHPVVITDMSEPDMWWAAKNRRLEMTERLESPWTEKTRTCRTLTRSVALSWYKNHTEIQNLTSPQYRCYNKIPSSHGVTWLVQHPPTNLTPVIRCSLPVCGVTVNAAAHQPNILRANTTLWMCSIMTARKETARCVRGFVFGSCLTPQLIPLLQC